MQRKFLSAGLAAAALVIVPTAGVAAPVAAIASQFNGHSLRDYIGLTGFATIPPDMAGAVSSSHVMQITNGGVSIHDRSGNRLSYQTGLSFLRASGISAADIPDDDGPFDPRLQYDKASGRFFGVIESLGPGLGPRTEPLPADLATSAALGGDVPYGTYEGPFKSSISGRPRGEPGRNNPIYVFVSKSSDPTEGFTAVKFNTAGGNFADFPTLGVNGDSLTIGTNNFNLVTGRFQGVSIFSVPKASLLAETPSLDGLLRAENLDPRVVGISPYGVSSQNAPDGTQKIVGVSVLAYRELQGLTLDANLPALFFDGVIDVTIQNDQRPARQPGDVSVPLDGGDTRIGSDLYQVGRYVYGTRGSGDSASGTPADDNIIHWFILDAITNLSVAEGSFSTNGVDYSYPSIAVSDSGTNFAIGYTGSGPDQVLSAFARVCEFNLGTTVYCGEEQLIKEGLDPRYILTFGGSRNRWGDYSDAQWDPTDPFSLWLFLEYPDAPSTNPLSAEFNTGRWATIITQLRLDALAVPGPGTLALFGLGLGGLLAARRRPR